MFYQRLGRILLLSSSVWKGGTKLSTTVQVSEEDDIIFNIFNFSQGSKKRASAEKISGTPPPRNKPKIHLYSEAVKNEGEESLCRRYQSVWVAPAETATVEEPGKGYRVHRSRAPNLQSLTTLRRTNMSNLLINFYSAPTC